MKNIKINHSQSGFTLIELMIVVAIIGILAAIAIPQYQDYIARSQVTRVVSEVSALKTAIEEELLRGADPAADDAGDSSPAQELGWTGSDLVSTAPSAQAIGVASTGVGDVLVTMDGNVSSGVTGTTVTLSRTAAGVWTCAVDGASASAFKDSFAPSGCPSS
jgi:type IV pilus assembly protein PilA